jgi:hypothetical protein
MEAMMCLWLTFLHVNFFGVSPLGTPLDPNGRSLIWCLRVDPNGSNQTNSDTKIGRPARDALRERDRRSRHGEP